MRWHYAVLVVLGVALLAVNGNPIERDEQTSLEESFADADKKDQVHIIDEPEEEETGDKKATIATNEEPEEEEETDETGNEHGEEDVTEDDVTKKDDITPVKTKEIKEKRDKKGQEKASSKVAKKHEDNSKKWWMVEGAHKWGGMGHSHWGPPHKTETETEHHDEGHFEGPDGEENHGERKHHVASCCKTKSKNLRKRCNCPHHEEKKEVEHPKAVKEHENGYHFHDKGGARSHNNDHDHELRGPWSFGYDGFGDDWGDWDHNHGQFDHLKDLEHESHGGHHEEVHEHEHEADKAAKEEDCGSKRDCIGAPLNAADDDGIDAPLAPPLGAAVAVAPLPGPAYAMPVPVLPAPPPVAHGHALPYRICHACHVLPDGGSRCLCKSIHPHHRPHHPHPHHANTHFNHHVYVDCDAAVHNFPANGQRCRARHDIPTPEHSKTTSGEAKQGVIYPYVGYGPWAAYPWWGDWWGGHGNHGWANNGCGAGGKGAEEGGHCKDCGCGEHGSDHGDDKHVVEVEHGAGLVHHDHGGGGGDDHDSHSSHDGMDKKRCCGCCSADSKHGVGFSFNPEHVSFRCHDVMNGNHENSESQKSKRFCVPVGNYGGYGWPYWHGYPGVGTGLWGWGWPWIKNKVPGSKGGNKSKDTDAKAKPPAPDDNHAPATTSDSTTNASAATPAATSTENKDTTTTNTADDTNKTTTRRSYIVPSHAHTKKQTIHMGYGYVSGDNYRLGYGFGGMGGVSDRNEIGGQSAQQSPFSRSRIASEYGIPDDVRRMRIPTPEKESTVTGSKRDIGHVIRRHHHRRDSY